MLKMTVGINGLLKHIERKLKLFRGQTNGISRREEEQVKELLLMHFICRDNDRIKRLETPMTVRVFKRLCDDHELENDLHYYGEVVGDMVMRYFDYAGDIVGYDCDVYYDLRRRKVFIEGSSECLRERLDR